MTRSSPTANPVPPLVNVLDGVPANVMLKISPLGPTLAIVIVRSLVVSAPPSEEPGMTIVSVAEYPVPALAGNTFWYVGDAPPSLSIVNSAFDPRPEYAPVFTLL